MGNGYDGNPYANEQGPADDDTDEVTNGLERIIEILESVIENQTDEERRTSNESQYPLQEALDSAVEALAQYTTRQQIESYQPDPKPGNECLFCTNWVDVENGHFTCANCVNRI